MKKLVFLLCVLAVLPAFAVGRSTIGAQRPGARAIILPSAQLHSGIKSSAGVENATGVVAVVDDAPQPAPINRDAERMACVRNNIGMNNTFVWAARDSNTSSYATMVEDVEHPENNVCFVLVGMRSQDSRINVSDIQPQYFEWGENITCGSWVDEAKMEARILDAKKSARTWGTIGGAVGGAGIGVGAMELFGNKLIGGAVQGQKNEDLSSVQLIASQAEVFKDENNARYGYFVELVEELKEFCGKSENANNQDCKNDKYANLIKWYDGYYKK